MQDFFSIWVGQVPGFGLRVEVFDEATGCERLLDIAVVVENPRGLTVTTNLLTIPVGVANFLQKNRTQGCNKGATVAPVHFYRLTI